MQKKWTGAVMKMSREKENVLLKRTLREGSSQRSRESASAEGQRTVWSLRRWAGVHRRAGIAGFGQGSN